MRRVIVRRGRLTPNKVGHDKNQDKTYQSNGQFVGRGIN
jgi:hypothetical protein